MDTSKIPMASRTDAIVQTAVKDIGRDRVSGAGYNRLWNLVNALLRGESTSISPVLMEIHRERGNQDQKWGVQNHPDFNHYYDDGRPFEPELRVSAYGLPSVKAAQAAVDYAASHHRLSWANVLIEEMVEAIGAPAQGNLRAELLQVAAVAVAWIEAIDRRTT